MYRVYCNIDTNNVEQVYDLIAEPALAETLTEDLFGDTMYCIDTEEPVTFNQRYNKESETFEINLDYVEPDTEVIPNKVDMVEKSKRFGNGTICYSECCGFLVNVSCI